MLGSTASECDSLVLSTPASTSRRNVRTAETRVHLKHSGRSATCDDGDSCQYTGTGTAVKYHT